MSNRVVSNRAVSSRAVSERTVSERAVVFGPGDSLVGVWTSPEGYDAESTPAVLIANSGIVHHVGIWRLHVRLARALAAIGLPSLRFDLSGIGDSDTHGSVSTSVEVIERDVDAALAYLAQSRGVEQFVTMGLCSGARDALEAARRDPRVVGTAMIDLVADLRTWRHHAVHITRRLFRIRSWANALSGKTHPIRRILLGEERANEPDLSSRGEPTRKYLEETLSGLLARGVPMVFVFTGGLEYNYNHKMQFRWAFPSLAKHPDLQHEYLPEADHTFSDIDQQSRLIRLISTWTATHFSVSHPSAV